MELVKVDHLFQLKIIIVMSFSILVLVQNFVFLWIKLILVSIILFRIRRLFTLQHWSMIKLMKCSTKDSTNTSVSQVSILIKLKAYFTVWNRLKMSYSMEITLLNVILARLLTYPINISIAPFYRRIFVIMDSSIRPVSLILYKPICLLLIVMGHISLNAKLVRI